MSSLPDETPQPVKIGILLSGRGSNFQAIANVIAAARDSDSPLAHADIALVISDRPSAPGLLIAEEMGIEATVFRPRLFPHREGFDMAVRDAFQERSVELVVLAGYNRIISSVLIKPYEGRMVNIHPSLLPAYGGKGMMGLAVHQAVLDAGETMTGCTVHGVTEVVDAGPILGQRHVPVLPDDTAETLAARVLAQEHQLYPEVIATLVSDIVAERKANETSSNNEVTVQ